MAASICTNFTYQNFQGTEFSDVPPFVEETEISDVPPSPSFWKSYQIKADLSYCDKKIKSLNKSGKPGETCSREITGTVLQNFKPSKRFHPDLNFIPSSDPEERFLPPEKQNRLFNRDGKPTDSDPFLR